MPPTNGWKPATGRKLILVQLGWTVVSGVAAKRPLGAQSAVKKEKERFRRLETMKRMDMKTNPSHAAGNKPRTALEIYRVFPKAASGYFFKKSVIKAQAQGKTVLAGI